MKNQKQDETWYKDSLKKKKAEDERNILEIDLEMFAAITLSS